MTDEIMALSFIYDNAAALCNVSDYLEVGLKTLANYLVHQYTSRY